MDLKIDGKCFVEKSSYLTVDAAGNKIPAESVIFYQMRAFIITEDGEIDKFAGEEMDVIYQAADKCKGAVWVVLIKLQKGLVPLYMLPQVLPL